MLIPNWMENHKKFHGSSHHQSNMNGNSTSVHTILSQYICHIYLPVKTMVSGEDFPNFHQSNEKDHKKILPSWRCREPVAGPKSDMANEVWNSLEISILAILYPSWTIFISVSYQFHMSFIWVSYPISMQRSPPSIHISVTAHGDYRQGRHRAHRNLETSDLRKNSSYPCS